MPYTVVIPEGKGRAPEWIEREHGIRCWNEDGTQYADDDRAQGLIDGYDPLPEIVGELRADLDRERQKRIDGIAEDRQRQLMTVQFEELLYLDRQQPDGLTAAQEQRQADLLTEWNKVSVIEAASARTAAEIDALASVAEAAALDVTDPARWTA